MSWKAAFAVTTCPSAGRLCRYFQRRSGIAPASTVRMAYFDHNATAPVSSEVVEAVAKALETYGNPSSVHAEGRVARASVEEARERVAQLVGAKPENVIFTSGATEANNQALRGCGRPQVLASAIEHPSVLEVAPDDDRIPVSADGVTDLDALSEMLKRAGG